MLACHRQHGQLAVIQLAHLKTALALSQRDNDMSRVREASTQSAREHKFKHTSTHGPDAEVGWGVLYLLNDSVDLCIVQRYGRIVVQQRCQKSLDLIWLNPSSVVKIIDAKGNWPKTHAPVIVKTVYDAYV